MNAVKRSGWVGWVVFAGVLLIVHGAIGIIQALIALIGPNEYYLVVNGSLWLLDVNGWGWWNLIIGALLLLVAFALFAGQTWARVVAIVLACLSALGAVIQIGAQPWWSLIVIAMDVLIIFALTVHGDELRSDNV